MERETRGAEWDEPNQLETAKINKLQAKTEVCGSIRERRAHMRTFAVLGAYLQGTQWWTEQMVLRPPPGFRKVWVEILWLMKSPLYEQAKSMHERVGTGP